MSAETWATRARRWIIQQPVGEMVCVDKVYDAVGVPCDRDLIYGTVGGVIRGAVASGLLRPTATRYVASRKASRGRTSMVYERTKAAQS